MKRILVIAPYPYLPFFSGGQKTIAQFIESLAAEATVTVISTVRNDASLVKNYRLLRWLINSPLRYLDVRFYLKLSRLLQQETFDCIIWEHPYFHWMGRLIQRKFNLFTIIHSHNIEYQRFRSMGKWWWPILRHYEGRCLKKADFVYFITPEDRMHGKETWELEPNRSDVLPLGIRQHHYPADRKQCQALIRERHHIEETTHILLFNGLLNYRPNREALDNLLKEINPRLQQANFNYRLLICGKGLPAEYDNLRSYQTEHIVYAGFVEDIETYFKAADVFLNPVMSGGGIKSKMVEAIGLGSTVVSTETGATGMLRTVCGEKLQLAADNDWDRFTSLVIEEASKETITPSAYYREYNWEQIVKRIPALLSQHFPG
jgi:hypothetical protein